MSSPKDYYFTKDHEWAREQDGVLLIGITDYAQNHLGDVVYLDLPEAGTAITAGSPFGTIESVKAAEDLNAPISGTVESINETLKDSPESVNTDPYGSWMIRLKGFDAAEVKNLMNADAYDAYIATLG